MDATTFSNTSSTITQVFREHPPSSYALKIESITHLNDEKYQSRRFSTGGHKWRLIIYPKGNKNDNGSGFISMYVEKDGKSEVFAYLKFFIYNNIGHQYLTTQDSEVKRFSGLKSVWGLAQVVPLDIFNDTRNGYIFEGNKCEFGVDVIVAPSPTNKWEILSFNEHLPVTTKFSWTIKNFSKLIGNIYRSNIFSRGGKKWVLFFYPNGYRREDKCVSIFLRLAESETLKKDEKIFTKGHLRAIDPRGSNHLSRQINNWHTRSTNWGYTQFLSLAEVRKVYLDGQDSLTIEVEFEVVSASKYSRSWF